MTKYDKSLNRKTFDVCAICGKPVIKETARYIKCIMLPNYPHGLNCMCELPIGEYCFKMLKQYGGKRNE